MQLTPSEKRNIIDNIFGLIQISEMTFKCKEYRSKIQDKMLENKNDIELTNEKIKLNKQFSEDKINNDIAIFETDNKKHNNDITSYINENKNIKNTNLQLTKKIIDLTVFIDKEKINIKNWEEKVIHADYDIKENIKNLKLIKLGNCSQCGHTWKPTEEQIQKVDDKIKRIQNDKKDIEKLSNDIDIVIKKYVKEKNEIDLLYDSGKSTIEKNEWAIENLNKTIGGNIKKIVELKKKKNNIDVIELEKKLKEYEDAYKKDYSMYNRMIRCESILADGGIRSYIIRKYLPMFNKSLKKYLNIMEATFMFEFDAEFNQKVDPRYRTALGYEGLSSGQKSRVNLAILFSLIDFAEKKSGSRINFLIMDETVDSIGLDNQGKESVLQILTHSIKKKLVFISHDKELQDNFDKSIEVELRGSFSHLTMK